MYYNSDVSYQQVSLPLDLDFGLEEEELKVLTKLKQNFVPTSNSSKSTKDWPFGK